MRYHTDMNTDRVSHLIGQCLRNKADAEKIYDSLVARNRRHIDLITGSVHLSAEEHAEFITRFSSEVEPTMWQSSFRKH
ncbi:MAG: hypothetical protein OET90_02695 [Desulfuromonadales bacterium]|nr:hypothetical protein [Desulfuromonadales bacterium]